MKAQTLVENCTPYRKIVWKHLHELVNRDRALGASKGEYLEWSSSQIKKVRQGGNLHSKCAEGFHPYKDMRLYPIESGLHDVSHEAVPSAFHKPNKQNRR